MRRVSMRLSVTLALALMLVTSAVHSAPTEASKSGIERDPLTGRFFQVVRSRGGEGFTWAEANTAATLSGGRLATGITTQYFHTITKIGSTVLFPEECLTESPYFPKSTSIEPHYWVGTVSFDRKMGATWVAWQGTQGEEEVTRDLWVAPAPTAEPASVCFSHTRHGWRLQSLTPGARLPGFVVEWESGVAGDLEAKPGQMSFSVPKSLSFLIRLPREYNLSQVDTTRLSFSFDEVPVALTVTSVTLGESDITIDVNPQDISGILTVLRRAEMPGDYTVSVTGLVANLPFVASGKLSITTR